MKRIKYLNLKTNSEIVSKIIKVIKKSKFSRKDLLAFVIKDLVQSNFKINAANGLDFIFQKN